MKNQRFQRTDAWIFLSINTTEDGTSLEDLIAKADYINHAIPSKDEIEGAVTRLSTAGLVRFENSKFILTDSGKEVYEYIHNGKDSTYIALWGKLEKHLNKSTFPFLEVDQFKLNLSQFQITYNIYNKRFLKTYRKLNSKDKDI